MYHIPTRHQINILKTLHFQQQKQKKNLQGPHSKMAFFPVEYGNEGEYLDENDAGVDTVLLSLVQSYDWQGTLARIRSFPEECR